MSILSGEAGYTKESLKESGLQCALERKNFLRHGGLVTCLEFGGRHVVADFELAIGLGVGRRAADTLPGQGWLALDPTWPLEQYRETFTTKCHKILHSPYLLGFIYPPHTHSHIV